MEEVAYLFIPYTLFCRVILKAKIGHEIWLVKSVFKMFDIFFLMFDIYMYNTFLSLL